MGVVNADIGPLADIIFIIEGTAINGAYLNDIKSNYIIPTLEYFSQGTLEERDYICESTSALYGLVIYHAADRFPSPSTDIYGPYSNPHKVLQMLDKIELVGGRGESHANIAEALAASLVCLEDLQLRRESGVSPQKHCILICNSPPYLMPVSESQVFAGNTAEQLATILAERNVHLSILSPRKIPALFKLYEKAGGDLSASQNKNYAKDPRHLVLLKGFSLKERPVSPTGGAALNIASLSSPLPSHGSPMAQPPQAQPPQPQPQPPILQGANAAGGGVRGFVGTPSSYHQGVRPPSRWPMMPPQQRPGFTQQPGSALIEQLTRPPSAIVSPFNTQYNVINVLDSSGMQPGGGLTAQQQQQQQQVAAAVVAQQQQQQQQQASVAAAQQQQQQQQQQMRMLASREGVPQQGVMGQPQLGQPQQQQPPNIMQPQQPQQGMMNPQQSVLSQQPGMLAQTAQLTGAMPQQTVMGQQQPNQVMAQNQQQPQQQPLVFQQLGRERHSIWQGLLEWVEKPKVQGDPQNKLTRHVPCYVTANVKDGEPELKADSWPQKLIMQLMPKQLIGNIGGAYLKNSKSVLFHPSSCEALDALTKVMSTGFAGCVHFPTVSTPCGIRVLILLYTVEKKAYLGFIPNDQTAFVDRLRRIIQQQKSTGLVRQTQGAGQAGQGGANMAGNQPQQQPTQQMGLLQQPTIAQQQQQQTINTGLGAGGVGQAGGPMMGTLQADASQQQQTQVANNQGGGQSGFSNQMVEAARQENLVKIQRLRQTLEAAQQQELQYKNQLEYMKIQQMQDSLQHAQQQEIQYKTQLEQEQQKQQLRAQLQQMQQQQQVQQQAQQQQAQQQQGQAQQQQQAQQQVRGIAPQQQPGQQRMMRPSTISNNPGLRHLLQQPQYRLNMQQQLPRGGLTTQAGQQNVNQQQFDDTYDFLT